MNMKLSRQSSEKTKKMRKVTEVKGQREQTVETDHEEIGIMTEIGKANEAPDGMSLGENGKYLIWKHLSCTFRFSQIPWLCMFASTCMFIYMYRNRYRCKFLVTSL